MYLPFGKPSEISFDWADLYIQVWRKKWNCQTQPLVKLFQKVNHCYTKMFAFFSWSKSPSLHRLSFRMEKKKTRLFLCPEDIFHYIFPFTQSYCCVNY